MAKTDFDHWAGELEGTNPTEGLAPEAVALLDSLVVFNDSVKPIFDAGLTKLVDTDAVIAPGIRLMPTPGHSPGHVSVVLESNGERAVITGDMVVHPCQFGRPTWPSAYDFDVRISEQTRRSFLEEFADTPTLIIGTHFSGPTAGHISRDEDGFRFSSFKGAS